MSTLFQLANLVAQAGGLFVVFFRHSLFEFVAKMQKLGHGLLVLWLPPGRLAAVLGLAVNILKQGQQLVAKLLVIVRAAQAPGIAELDKLDPAFRAFMLVEK